MEEAKKRWRREEKCSALFSESFYSAYRTAASIYMLVEGGSCGDFCLAINAPILFREGVYWILLTCYVRLPFQPHPSREKVGVISANHTIRLRSRLYTLSPFYSLHSL
jgi:hypothetical protein